MQHSPDGRTGAALRTREQRAWAMYDWANSAFMTTIVAAVFPIYYDRVAAAGLPESVRTARYFYATTIALALVALAAPVLGAMADLAGLKKRLLAVFQIVGVGATLAMAGIGKGDWAFALFLFVVANIGAWGALVFYDSLLPHVAEPHELDRVSSAGYALGYLGGGVLLALNLLWIQQPAWFGLPDAGVATRLSFASVGLWWLLFSVPLFRRVTEPPSPSVARPPLGALVRSSFAELASTLGRLRQFRQAFLMLTAFLVYNDGIGTIIRAASIYGTQLGIETGHLIGAFLLVQFVGVPFAFLFGRLGTRIGAKRAVFLSLAVYAGISVLGYFMTGALHFYVLAFLVGTVQGGSQALSRSLFASMIPRARSSEFFGFFAVFEKFAGIFGPLVFAATVSAFGSSRVAVLSVIAFFVVGAALLALVDVEEGRRQARDAEREDARHEPPAAR